VEALKRVYALNDDSLLLLEGPVGSGRKRLADIAAGTSGVNQRTEHLDLGLPDSQQRIDEVIEWTRIPTDTNADAFMTVNFNGGTIVVHGFADAQPEDWNRLRDLLQEHPRIRKGKPGESKKVGFRIVLVEEPESIDTVMRFLKEQDELIPPSVHLTLPSLTDLEHVQSIVYQHLVHLSLSDITVSPTEIPSICDSVFRSLADKPLPPSAGIPDLITRIESMRKDGNIPDIEPGSTADYSWITKRIDKYTGRPFPPRIGNDKAHMPDEDLKGWTAFLDGFGGDKLEKFEIIEAETRHLKSWSDKDRYTMIGIADKSEYSNMVKTKYGPREGRKQRYPNLHFR
jgi:hypothetical protein